jgi:hypothetical protein
VNDIYGLLTKSRLINQTIWLSKTYAQSREERIRGIFAQKFQIAQIKGHCRGRTIKL